jgi:hypothetical protein
VPSYPADGSIRADMWRPRRTASQFPAGAPMLWLTCPARHCCTPGAPCEFAVPEAGPLSTRHTHGARRTAELQCPTTAFDRLIGIARYNSPKESSSHSHPFKVDSDCCRGMFGERARGSRGSLGLGLSAENSLSVVVAGWNSISAIVAIRSLRHKHSEGHNDVSSTAPLCAANSRGSLACAREGVDSTFGSG